LRDRNDSFEDLVAYSVTQVALDTDKNPTPTWGLETSGNYFDALRIQPYLGRFFHNSDENGPNSAPYMVLSYSYWHSDFHDDRGVLGRVVQVNKHPFTIIGIAPPKFRGTLVFLSPNFFVPIVDCEQVEGTDYLKDRGNRSVMQVMGHLRAGVTLAQATADLNSIAAYLEKTYPKDNGQMSFSLARPNIFGDQFARPFAAFLGGLMLLAGLILLIAPSAFAQQAVPNIAFDSEPNPLKLPANMYFGEVSGVSVNSRGHVFVLSRGNTTGPAYAAAATQLLEFDSTGVFVREIGKNLYAWSFGHTVKVDPQDNIWVTDKGSDMVVKFNPAGRVLMVFGRKQEASVGDTQRTGPCALSGCR